MARSAQFLTIATTENDSTPFHNEARQTRMGLYIPSTFDGTLIRFKAATSLNVASVEDPPGTFTATYTYSPVRDFAGNLVEYTVATDTWVTLGEELSAFQYLKVTAVTAQTGATILVIVGHS